MTRGFEFVPTMRRVEKAAWNTLRRCAKAKNISVLPLPIPVEEWAEGPLGIRLELGPDGSLGPNVLGCADTVGRVITICEGLLENLARYRFTVAHEVGHIVLHGKVAPEFRELEWGDLLDTRIEREADRFAAALLMPIPVFSSEYASLATECGHQAGGLLSAVNAGDIEATGTFRTRIARPLATRFGVSLTAMIRRFADVRLPGGEWALDNSKARQLVPNPDGFYSTPLGDVDH